MFPFSEVGHPRVLSFSEVGHPRVLSFSEVGHSRVLSFSEVGHPMVLPFSEVGTRGCCRSLMSTTRGCSRSRKSATRGCSCSLNVFFCHINSHRSKIWVHKQLGDNRSRRRMYYRMIRSWQNKHLCFCWKLLIPVGESHGFSNTLRCLNWCSFFVIW